MAKLKSQSQMANVKNILILFFFVSADIVSKFAAERYLDEPVVLIENFLRLQKSTNSGIAFGLPFPNVAVAALTPIVLFIVWEMLRKHLHEKPVRVSLILICAGALGNLVDRIFRGAVVDFISFSFWPSFNLADSYLTISVFLLIISYAKIK